MRGQHVRPQTKEVVAVGTQEREQARVEDPARQGADRRCAEAFCQALLPGSSPGSGVLDLLVQAFTEVRADERQRVDIAGWESRGAGWER
jgi:hypothetical protein